MKVDLAELRRRANANLAYIASGQARADKEQAAQLRKDRAAQEKQRKLKKRIKALRLELKQHDEFYAQCEASDNPLGYAEGMTPAQHQGLLEEIDATRDKCLAELLRLEATSRA